MAQLHTTRHRGLAFIIALLFFVLSFQTLASQRANAWHTQNIQYLNAAEIKIEKITFETADLSSDGVLNSQLKTLSNDDARAVELINTYVAALLQNGSAIWKDTDSFDLTTQWVLKGCKDSKIVDTEIDEIWVNIPSLGCIDVLKDNKNLQPGGLSRDNLRAVKNIQFRWINAKTIVRIDGKETFTQTEDVNFPNRFFNVTDTTRYLDVNRSDLSQVTARAGQYPGRVNDGSLVFKAEAVDKADDPATLNPDGSIVVTGADGTPTQEVSCESNDTTGLGWISCAIIRAIDGTLNTINDQVQTIMEINVEKLQQGGSLKAAWSNIRNISTVLLVLIALIMVASTALNVGPFDAYTIRKILPRLAAAVILMVVSWPLMILLIEITNDVGNGLQSLMLAPFGGDSVTSLSSVLSQSGAGSQSGFFNAVAAGAIVTGGLALGILGLLSLAFTTVLGVIIGFVVLVLRNIVIVASLVLAPFAIICYILPGTEKIGKLWWDAFSKGLLMFPIIMLLFTSGRIFAHVTANTDAAAQGTFGDPIQFFIVIAAYVIPYFLIPATFKLAGGAVATLGGMVNDRSKGIFDRNKKFRAGKTQQSWKDMQTGNRFKGTSGLSRKLNNGLEIATNSSLDNIGVNPMRMRARMQAVRGRNSVDEALEAREKNHDYKSIMGNEDYLEAGKEAADVVRDKSGGVWLDSNGNEVKRDGSMRAARAYLEARGYTGRDLNQGVAAIQLTKRSMSNESFNRAAAMDIVSTGTGYGSGAGEMAASLAEAAGNDTLAFTRMIAQTRGLASQARRPDLAGGGFGFELSQADTVRQALNAPNATRTSVAAAMSSVTEAMDRETLRTQSGGTIASMKATQLKRLSALMYDDVKTVSNTASVAGTPLEDDAVRTALREFGAIAGRHDVANQISPEQAGIIADNVLSQEVEVSTMSPKLQEKLRAAIEVTAYDPATGRTVVTSRKDRITIQQANEALASDPVYKEARKEYATAAGAAGAAAAAAGVGGAPTAPPTSPTGTN